jgi:hypothetical protein
MIARAIFGEGPLLAQSGRSHTHLRMGEENMRPTIASDDNVFDFKRLLHPGAVFEHVKEVIAHHSPTLAEKRAILASTSAPRSFADLYYCGPGRRRADRNSVRDVGCPRASFAFVLAPTRTCFTVASGTAIGLSPRTGRQPLLAEP